MIFMTTWIITIQSSADPNPWVLPLLTSLSKYYEKQQKNPVMVQ